MFAYCGNNPVCYSDPTGHIALVDDLPALLGLATAVVGRYNINDFFDKYNPVLGRKKRLKPKGFNRFL